MLDRVYSRRFSTIKTNLEKNTTFGMDSYPRTKYKMVELIKNYHVSNQTDKNLPVKGEFVFKKNRWQGKYQ